MTNLLFSHPPPPLVDAILRDDVLILLITSPEFFSEPFNPTISFTLNWLIFG